MILFFSYCGPGWYIYCPRQYQDKGRVFAITVVWRRSQTSKVIKNDMAESNYCTEKCLYGSQFEVIISLHRIRLRSDKKFVLGEEKSDELVSDPLPTMSMTLTLSLPPSPHTQAFDTVMDLVSHHKRDPLHLKSGGETVLKYECPS